MEDSVIAIPLWAELLTAFFALLGGVVALLGASGLLRLHTFFSRIHAPALITTAGIWCLMLATITYFTVTTSKPALNVFLLGLFISITSPVTTIFLMRAALFRARQRGEDVPRSVNVLRIATPKSAPEIEREEQELREEGRRNRLAKEQAEALAHQQREAEVAVQQAKTAAAQAKPASMPSGENTDDAEAPSGDGVASFSTNTDRPDPPTSPRD
ncbi:cation:proton antiporter [Lampropedia cohaerens]|uniref:cation:proton antiporter n=1 Tax=Lampropedia cohaerens TaxID=1610491 RepID=UPI000A07C817